MYQLLRAPLLKLALTGPPSSLTHPLTSKLWSRLLRPAQQDITTDSIQAPNRLQNSWCLQESNYQWGLEIGDTVIWPRTFLTLLYPCTNIRTFLRGIQKGRGLCHSRTFVIGGAQQTSCSVWQKRNAKCSWPHCVFRHKCSTCKVGRH